MSEIEEHWHECRHCREIAPCDRGLELARHAKTYGDQREWAWACKILLLAPRLAA